ncbi:MAG: TonB family protein [Saprospiraceae bacterium]|nr:TonB family protein [Saprospiraceae bacterium]
MELAFQSGTIGVIVFLLLAIIAGLIIYFRRRLNSYDHRALKEQHGEVHGAELLTSRAKYPEADGFRWSGTFLNFSLFASLVLILLAFNWTTYPRDVYIPEGALDLSEDIEIEPPRTAEPPPPPPPPPPPVIEEVPEELIEEDQPEFVDQSLDKEEEVKAPERPAAPPPPPPPPPPKEEEIFVIAEDMPRFPGCEDLPSKKEKEACAQKKMLEFIYANIKYPPIARENGVEGTVVVTFVVEKDGAVKDAKIVRDIGAGCGDEALRVVELMNKKSLKWTPGKQRGKPVRVQFNLPVKFKLQ